MTHLPLFESEPLRILSVRQPWAHLIVSGRKTIENRSWKTDYRGPILIHAGVHLHAMPIEHIERLHGLEIDRASLVFGAVIGRVELVDIVTQSSSPWFEGPYGWILRGAQAIAPIPLRGQMGLYAAPIDLMRQLSSPR